MSLIQCTQTCRYQRDGYCTLDHTLADPGAAPNDYCINYTPVSQIKPESPAPHEYS